jgi:hypothetical protein
MKEPLISTALGTTLHTNNKDAISLLAETIEISDVEQVSFVADINAIMIRNFMNGNTTGMVTVDRFYQYVFDLYENEIMETESSYKQRFTFIEYLVKEQVKELHTAFDQLSSTHLADLRIDGYIVDRSADTKWSIFENAHSYSK